MHHFIPRIRIYSLILCALGCRSVSAETPVDFAREVLPILSDKCFLCHGPDAKKKNPLRLDSYAGATSDRGGYKAIDPEHLEKSEILVRLHDAEDPMPPKDAEQRISPKEREIISRWVRQGGGYASHWAFVPPRAWPSTANSIDAQIEKKLKQAGTSFAPEADRPTLARRAALVLTGLPPEPAQLQTYLNDSQPDAYARLVDQLLASPRFGEHQARAWLDAVRYGDTHGLHLDNRRAIFPYRDWVVRALNQNRPFNQFITEQLAGDLLPEPTLDQQIATGFVRLNPSTAEGGAIPAEFQAKNNFDRTENLGTALLGLTLTCARCHTHKYDPITQTEYYQLLAFFNSTAESPMDGNSYIYQPILRVPADQEAWENWQTLEQHRDTILANAGDLSATSNLLAYAQSTPQWKVSNWQATAPVAADQPAPTDGKAWKNIDQLPGENRKEKLPETDRVRWLRFTANSPVAQRIWVSVSGGPDSQAFINDREVTPCWSGRESITVALDLAAGEQVVQVKMSGLPNAPRIRLATESPWHTLAKSKNWKQLDATDQLLALADPLGPLANIQDAHRAAAEFALQVVAARTQFTETLVTRELPQPRPTHVLMRGEYDHPMGDPVQPGVLQIMGTLPKDAPTNRLGLAQWLTARNNPLVARVLVNRFWQGIFGQGLVRTPEDFGLQGEHPTHPELLDGLAVKFMEQNWDLKALMREMVTSRTFKQDSAWRAELNDPENRLWARGPSYRLDAEVIRDLGLWAGDLLDPTMGGEGIKPYQPAGMWLALMHPASNTKLYEADQGPRLYRRSLYVYWKRTSPHPMMTLFNAPDRESSCVQRSRTSTPLQSLALFNETQRVEMGRAVAERLMKSIPSDEERLTALFSWITCRPPNPAERSACLQLLTQLREQFGSHADDARTLLQIGDAPRDESLPLPEHAAWTQVAITVLASDLSILLY